MRLDLTREISDLEDVVCDDFPDQKKELLQQNMLNIAIAVVDNIFEQFDDAFTEEFPADTLESERRLFLCTVAEKLVNNITGWHQSKAFENRLAARFTKK